MGKRCIGSWVQAIVEFPIKLLRIPLAYGRLVSFLLFLILPAQAIAAATPAVVPQPPCGTPPYPAFPAVDAPPNVTFWTARELGETWTPPACTGWNAASASVVVALAGRFTSASDAEAILARMGKISLLRDVLYWSVTDKKWDGLFVRATSLSKQDPNAGRGDFSAAELRAGRPLYFLTADNRSQQDVVTELRVKEFGADRIVLETKNVSPLRWFEFTLVPPKNIHSIYFFERVPDGSWQFYCLTRFVDASFLFPLIVPESSQINRAVAMYRHLAGIPTDRAPPASP